MWRRVNLRLYRLQSTKGLFICFMIVIHEKHGGNNMTDGSDNVQKAERMASATNSNITETFPLDLQTDYDLQEAAFQVPRGRGGRLGKEL